MRRYLGSAVVDAGRVCLVGAGPCRRSVRGAGDAGRVGSLGHPAIFADRPGRTQSTSPRAQHPALTCRWNKVSMAAATKVRVLVVDDSPSTRTMLREALAMDDDIEVVGEAGSGREAVTRTTRRRTVVGARFATAALPDDLDVVIMASASRSIVRVLGESSPSQHTDLGGCGHAHLVPSTGTSGCEPEEFDCRPDGRRRWLVAKPTGRRPRSRTERRHGRRPPHPRRRPPPGPKYLRIYLDDHLAFEAGGLALVGQLRQTRRGSFADVLDRLLKEQGGPRP